jgi:hypothetical protein
MERAKSHDPSQLEFCANGSVSSYDDGAADGTAGLAGRQIRALVQGEAASSTSVPARSADNGNGVHNVKIAVVA